MKRNGRRIFGMFLAAFTAAIFLPVIALAAESTVKDVATKEEFLEAVEDESITVIRLTADMDLTDADVLDVSGKTIDLGGYKISADNFSLIFEGTDFTLQNGTFDSNGGSYALFIGDMGTTDHVIVENITAVGGINVFNASNVILRNVDVTGADYYAVWCDENGKVTIESGTFRTNGNAVLGLTTEDSVLEIEGGDFITDGKPLVLEDEDNWGKPTISGGNFDVSVEPYLKEGSDAVSDGNGGYLVCDHSGTEIRNEKAATCTEAGYTGDVYCRDCGKFLQAGTEIPAEGHTYSEWKSDKEYHWKECIVEGCEEILADSKAAHMDEDGDGKCDVCGYELEIAADVNDPAESEDGNNSTEPDNEEPANPVVRAPKTGDGTEGFLWAVFLLAGAGTMGVLICGQKRKI